MTNPAEAITVRLLGGAGNQLFQYAAGRALADHLNCPLALDSRYVAGSRDRGDCFEHFGNARFTRDIRLPPAKKNSILKYGLWRTIGRLPRLPRLHRERSFSFDPTFFKLPRGTYLQGYWQSPQYFGDPATLRRDLAFTTALDASNSVMATHIKAAQGATALHVRRGDYLTIDAHGACPPDYYRQAVDEISMRTSGPLTCFVFSNDPDWARSNLNLNQETIIVDLNDECAGHFDMALMATCTHHVIANSTFSWWGAWLSNEPGITVAPKVWFADPKRYNPDIYLADWLRV